MVTTTFMHAPTCLEQKDLHNAVEQGIEETDGSDGQIVEVLKEIKERIENGDFGPSNFHLDFYFKKFADPLQETIYSVTYTFYW